MVADTPHSYRWMIHALSGDTREGYVEIALRHLLALVALLTLMPASATIAQDFSVTPRASRENWARYTRHSGDTSVTFLELEKSDDLLPRSSIVPSAEAEGEIDPPSEEMLPVPPQALSSQEAAGPEEIDGEDDDPWFLWKGPPDFFSTGSWFRTGEWYTQQDIVMLHRGQPNVIVLASDQIQRLTTVTDKHGFEAGTRMTLGRMLGRDEFNRDHMVEFTFLGLFDWAARAEIQAGNFDIDTLLDPLTYTAPGFNDADLQNFTYKSDLDSYEMNLRIRSRSGRDRMVLQPNGAWVRHNTPSKFYSILAGFRYVGIEELFIYRSRETNPPPSNDGDYKVNTHNDMFGVQFGFDATEQYSEWSWGFRAKAAALVNFADRRSRIDIVAPNTTGYGEDVHDETLVFLGEAGLFAEYYFCPTVTLRIAYDFLYLNGLALAAENLALLPNSFPPFDTGSSVLYNGLSLGFEMYW